MVAAWLDNVVLLTRIISFLDVDHLIFIQDLGLKVRDDVDLHSMKQFDIIEKYVNEYIFNFSPEIDIFWKI